METILINTVKVMSMLLVVSLAYGAFNPKYRYNEHETWDPPHFWIWCIILFIWVAIVK